MAWTEDQKSKNIKDLSSAKTVVFDFNGTIIDDRNLCLNILNSMLKMTHHKEVSLEEYLNIFTFPIFDYYVKAGFDLKEGGKDSFTELAAFFDKAYSSSFMNCPIFPDVKKALTDLKPKKKLILLSATKQETLEKQISYFGLGGYFDIIAGIKDIYAFSKIEAGTKVFADNGLDPKKAVFIGDTMHDEEIAKKLGSFSILVSRGHQSEDVLRKGKSDLIVKDLIQAEKAII